MTEQSLIIGVLAVLMCACAATLWFDSQQRQLNRQLANILPEAEAASLPSIRRLHGESRWLRLAGMVDYSRDIPYGWHPAFVLLAGVIAAASIFYVNRFVGLSMPAVSILAAVAALVVVRSLFRWQKRRFAGLLFRQLPDTIQLVTSTIRSGLPVNEAFRTIARDMPQPTAGQFTIVCSELNLGKSPEEAIEAIYQRTGVTEYAIFAVTLAVQLKSGGNLSETLQTLGETINQRVALAARAKALAAEVIFSSRALSAAPLIVGGLLYSINPRSVDLLFTDPTGNRLLAYAVLSVIAGHFVIRWMIRRETTL